LNLDFIEELLQEVPQETNQYPHIEQFGPLRQYDKEMRCTSRRCGSSTFFKVSGMSMCVIHALRELNEMLVRRGVER